MIKTKVMDGKFLAGQIELELKNKAQNMAARDIYPKLVSILIGEDKASQLFLTLKQKAAERTGCILEIRNISINSNTEDILQLIKLLNNDKSVTGIMVQLPIPQGFDRDLIIEAISDKKDVDGMKDNSRFTTPVIKAINKAIEESRTIVKSATIVGADGFVGKKLNNYLLNEGYEIIAIDLAEANLKEEISKSDLVISATGQPNLITGEMIKEGAVVIDVGSPQGDIQKESVTGKVGFLSPVPGGVGPLTIAYLMENLIDN